LPGLWAQGPKREAETDKRVRRAAVGFVVLATIALVAAAPAAAAQPTRTVVPGQPVSHFPAGSGCTFAVTAYQTPGSRVTITDFSDGTHVTDVHAMHRTIVNDATGATFGDNQEFHDVEWIDPTTGLLWA